MNTGLRLTEKPDAGGYDGIVLAVAHREFAAMGADALRRFGKANHVLFDVKHMFSPEQTDLRL